ncbi:SLAP domain-containing protein [Companilactobacillus furfuricola]|uniref:SLAP domain-containing protein n=1 Tax=Companilactobacillus furfuricola TaxID=1462575 RepID=UPI000F78137C|nr:SLAP domain-containing protein [Companilactobacillus furfuricola]
MKLKQEFALIFLPLLCGVTFSLFFTSEETTQASVAPIMTSLKGFASGCTITMNNAPLYNNSGQLTNHSLAQGTSWYTDQEMTLNNDTYYRVAKNEFVKMNDAYLYQNNVENIKVISKSPAQLYDHSKKPIANRKVQPGSIWYSDRSITFPGDHFSMMRISTDEWIAFGDANFI